MGRKYTGAVTVNECAKLDIRFLVRYGFVVNGKQIAGVIEWERGGSINYFADLTGADKYMRLLYSVNTPSGERKDYDYKINIATRPANLGKGEILYLVCPVSGKTCSILYTAYGSDIWQRRETFTKRIYYSTQIASKNWVNNSRYWQLSGELNKLSNMRAAGIYAGKITHRAERTQRLITERERQNQLRFRMEVQPLWLQQRLQATA